MKKPGRHSITELGAKDSSAKTAKDMDTEMAVAFSSSILSTTDDTTMPAFTVRAVFIGLLFAIVLACFNSLFAFRTNFFTVSSTIATLLAYPMGIFLARVVPDVLVFGIQLNPGKFSVKEHVIVTSVAASGGGSPYGIYNVISQYFQTLINDKNINVWNSLAWVFCTQFIGYGLAGLCRRFIVKPKSMLWPTKLPYVALYNSFHQPDLQKGQYRYSRYTVFWIAFLGMFMYHWIPNYLAKGLSIVSIVCLLTSNKAMNFLSSGRAGEGVGFLSLTFDWSVVNMFYQPMTQPFWASVNTVVAYIFWGYIVAPLLYYYNPLQSPELKSTYFINDNLNGTLRSPFGIMNKQTLFNKNGSVVLVARGSLLNIDDNNLNTTFYESNKPIWLTASFTIYYFAAFINMGAIISHIYLWYGSDLAVQVKAMFTGRATDDGQDDIHSEMMKAYPEIPDWVYGLWLLLMLVVAFFVTQFTPYKLPIWGPVFGLLVGFVYVIPVGILTAIAGYTPGLNILTQLIMGFILPGKTIENMIFKSYSFNIMLQALDLAGDLKIGHYMKINPIHMVAAQFLGTLMGVLFNTATAFYVMDNMTNMLLTNVQWQYTNPVTFTQAGGIWGAISPYRFFGLDGPYGWALAVGLPLGLLLPLLPFLINKLYPSRFWYLINFPLLTAFNAGQGRDAATVVMPFLVAYYFNFYLFRSHKPFWDRYHFVLSVGFDAGMALSTFFATLLIFWFPGASQTGWASSDLGTYYCRADTWESALAYSQLLKK